MAQWEALFTAPGTSAQIYLVLQVDVASQSIPNNTTTLNWYLRMEERVNASPYRATANSIASVAIDGASVYSASNLTYDFRGTNTTIYVASGTAVVGHNAGGDKGFVVAASYNGHNIIGTAGLSEWMVVPTIPRATAVTVSPTSGVTGSALVIGHSPASAAFYHDIAYSLNGGSFVNIQTNIPGTTTSTSWTPAHTLLPNAGSGTVTIRLTTRATSGGTVIGTTTRDVPISVPASVKPTISSVTFEEAQLSGPNLPSLMGGAGRFVQRWSRLKPTVTSAGAGGSTIASSTLNQGGQITQSGTPFVGPVTLSGTVPITALVTDSRGRSSDSFNATVAVKAYNFPNLPTPGIVRTSDAAGNTPSTSGTFLKVTPAASVSALNFGDGEKNLLEWQIRTRPVGGSWTTVQAWTAATVSGSTWTTPKVLSGYSAATSYEVEVSIRDLFGKNGFSTNNTVKKLTIPVASESVDSDWIKEGVAFGQYHTGTGARLQVADGIESTAASTRILQRGGKGVLDDLDYDALEALAYTALAGTSVFWAGTSTPPSHLIPFNGQTVTNGATRFPVLAARHPEWVSGANLVMPNYGGRVMVSRLVGDTDFGTLGALVGSKTTLLTAAQSGLRAHTHTLSSNILTFASSGAGNNGAPLAAGNNIGTQVAATAGSVTAANATEAHSNVQPSAVGVWCVVAGVPA